MREIIRKDARIVSLKIIEIIIGLILEYTDICNGQKTRRMVFPNGFVYETPIDHVLIKDSSELKKKYQCKIVKIERNEDNVSDHYPIYFKLSCLDEADKLH